MLLPTTCETGVEHERIALPSACTVHAPHKPAPQPNLVPVSSSVSRRTQRSGVSGETETFFSLPLMRSVRSAMFTLGLGLNAVHHGTQVEGKGKWREPHSA